MRLWPEWPGCRGRALYCLGWTDNGKLASWWEKSVKRKMVKTGPDGCIVSSQVGPGHGQEESLSSTQLVLWTEFFLLIKFVY